VVVVVAVYAVVGRQRRLVGSRPVYSYRRGPSPYAWVVVRDDGCYRFYGGDVGG